MDQVQKNHQQYKQDKLEQQNQKQKKAKKQGPWHEIEQRKYIIFLQAFKKQLQNRQKRKNYKIFKQMAEFVGSRDGIQCRSHHMKLLRTHSKIRKIILHFKKVLNIYAQDKEFLMQVEHLKPPRQNQTKNPLTKKNIKAKKRKVEAIKAQSKYTIENEMSLQDKPESYQASELYYFVTSDGNFLYFFPFYFQKYQEIY